MASVLRTIRQPRYAALGALMLAVALVCVACGVWQVYRFEGKHDANDQLRRNAHRAVTSVSSVLPVVGRASAPSEDGTEFRQVRVTGRYDGAGQTLVRNRTRGGDDDTTGFLVVTPLRTGGATLLVVRGFIAQPDSGAIPVPPPPPAARVTITARAQSPETRTDQFSELSGRQVSSINPHEQAARLGGTLYDGYAELEAGQPGTDGLQSLASPDLSNPAGGALEPQHFAYVIQWFLFAALALAAPVVMARAETRRDERDDPADEPATTTANGRGRRAREREARDAALAGDPEPAHLGDDDTDRNVARLASRYGRQVH